MAGHDVRHKDCKPLLPFVHRKVVGIHVTFQAAAEALVQSFSMRFAMTILAGGNFSVRGMTSCALQ